MQLLIIAGLIVAGGAAALTISAAIVWIAFKTASRGNTTVLYDPGKVYITQEVDRYDAMDSKKL